MRRDQLEHAIKTACQITSEETARLSDLVESVAGELSPFEDLHGFSIDGVDLNTAVLPNGWRNRLVRVRNANTDIPGTTFYISGAVSCDQRH